MKVTFDIKLVKVKEVEINKKFIEENSRITSSASIFLKHIANSLQHDYFSRNRVSISEPEISVNAGETLIGKIEFSLLKVMGKELTPQMKTSIVVKSFEKDLQFVSRKIAEYFKNKHIDIEIKYNLN